jgi:hypothetical protein
MTTSLEDSTCSVDISESTSAKDGEDGELRSGCEPWEEEEREEGQRMVGTLRRGEGREERGR